MALSESGLAAQGISGGVFYGPKGRFNERQHPRGYHGRFRVNRAQAVVRGGRKQSYYVRPKR